MTSRFTTALFTLTVFTSAFLLFGVQPMFTKMVLPLLGGSPAVWSVAMVFFQAVLLLGYLYAHLSTRYLGTRNAVLLHAALMLATFILLPIAVSQNIGRPPEQGQMFWLIKLFAISVGLPFFAVSANGPLLQAWFARTNHQNASNPYFLYAASNIGSFAALLLYPTLFEVVLRLKLQAYAWSIGFAVLFILIAATGLLTLRIGNVSAQKRIAETKLIAWPNVAKYIWLAFVPSALLVAVTAHIATDVASAPFIWIIPLSLFLLTFVIIFRDAPLIPIKFINAAVPILAGVVLLCTIYDVNTFIVLGSHLVFFFAAALMHHQRLYELRPKAEQLTQFYLWMSFGGVLGGIFSGLLAPYIFNSIVEYPILVSLVMLAHPDVYAASKSTLLRQFAPTALLGIAIIAAVYLLQDSVFTEGSLWLNGFIIVGACTVLGMFRHNIIRATLIPTVFILLAFKLAGTSGTTFERSFFGVDRISINEGGQFRVLSHGTTVHGATRIKNFDGSEYKGPPTPLTYYHPDGTLADTLKRLPTNAAGRDIAIVGLGTGAQACNGLPSDRFTYFEIDQLVVQIAKDTTKFQFLSQCAPDAKIVVGDARLTLSDQPAASFDYMLLDAFSSDSIPIHLLTREAVAIYISKLKENGLLVIHISNRNMELQDVTWALANDAGLTFKARIMPPPTGSFADPYQSSVVIMARKPETLSAFTAENGWTTPSYPGTPIWTDDYSNIAAAIYRKYFP